MIIYDGVMTLVNDPKMVLASSSFYYLNIMMNSTEMTSASRPLCCHGNFSLRGLLLLPNGHTNVLNHEKKSECAKSELEAVFLKFIVNSQSEKAIF